MPQDFTLSNIIFKVKELKKFIMNKTYLVLFPSSSLQLDPLSHLHLEQQEIMNKCPEILLGSLQHRIQCRQTPGKNRLSARADR
jgi:hypothetical protein